MSRLMARINAHEESRRQRECQAGRHAHVLRSRWANLDSVCLDCHVTVK